MPDVILRARDSSRGQHDVQSFAPARFANDIRLYARDGSLGVHDVQLRANGPSIVSSDASPPAFPTQYSGFRIRKTSSTIDLCMVATADAPSGMGGQLRIRRPAGTFAVYLVETSDPNASPVRIRTSAGTKAIRLKT